jgi:hypothetical protein
MNLHRNKIIFLGIAWVIALLIVFMIINVNKTNEQKRNTKRVKEFSIWTTWDADNKVSLDALIDKFKEENWRYKNTDIEIKMFPDYLSYKNTLKSAIINDKWPDVFSLNNMDINDEVSWKIMWITAEDINPDYIRENFVWVFWRDLILSSNDWENNIEFLAWVPLWFDALSLIYNTRYLRWKDLDSWAWINSTISDLKEEKPELVPIALWRWSGITNAVDIFSQMLMQDWVDSAIDIWWKVDQTILRYSEFWSTRWENKFDKLSTFIKNWQDDIDFLTSWKVAIIAWYLKDFKKITEKANSSTKRFLRAWTFPAYTTKDTPNLISYNYFLINKDSENEELAKDLFRFFVSKDWQRAYAENFPYSLPADLDILAEIEDDKINDKLVIKYSNFFDSQVVYSSFNKGYIELYNTHLPLVLDSLNIKNEFTNLSSKILCVYNKVAKFQNLEASCGY